MIITMIRITGAAENTCIEISSMHSDPNGTIAKLIGTRHNVVTAEERYGRQFSRFAQEHQIDVVAGWVYGYNDRGNPRATFSQLEAVAAELERVGPQPKRES